MRNQPGRQGLYHPRYEKDGCGIGAVVHCRGVRSHELVKQGLQVLQNLHHRGAQGYDPVTGDGAGIMLQIPHDFLAAELAKQRVALPARGDYAVGMLLLPADAAAALGVVAQLRQQCAHLGLGWLGERRVPVCSEHLGPAAAAVEPTLMQVFVKRPAGSDGLAFERQLYLARRLLENRVQSAPELALYAKELHFCSFSPHTIVYKGMLLPAQLARYFPDLTNASFTSAIAVVHSRFSTNTFPAWKLAHPFHYLCHNGEINTIRGNLHWMRAREKQLASELFGDYADQLLPLIRSNQSDSACLDDAVELLMLTGRSLPEAIAMLVPAAWQKDAELDDQRRAYAQHQATLMEPWDGPAALCFTDGRIAGVALDRSGLRPCRYTITHQDLVILSSETGVLPVAGKDIKTLGKLRPGEMLVIDTVLGEVRGDDELKNQLAQRSDLRPWARHHLLSLTQQRVAVEPAAAGGFAELPRLQTAFGISRDELAMALTVMGTSGEEPVNSMGDDTPLAILSETPRLLFDYFKQQFAQVTNPPLDPLREDMVMSLTMYLGPKANLAATPQLSSPILRIDTPVLVGTEWAALKSLPGLHAVELSLLFPTSGGVEAFVQAVDELLQKAVAAVRNKAGLLILSDRGVDAETAALPSLLAVSAVHHRLVQQGLRLQADLVVETGEARTAHHIACLIGYGAGAVHPYLALDSLALLHDEGAFAQQAELASVQALYVKACVKGLSKILSKMGIATLQSYCGAQMFEAIGLGSELVASYFPGTSTRLDGLNLRQLADETLRRHAFAYDPNAGLLPPLGGYVHYRIQGEKHGWNPDSIALLQHATQLGSAQKYAEYQAIANAEAAAPTALRHLFGVRTDAPGQAIALADVEAAKQIVRRFTTGAMSLGAISKEAHETLAVAMNRIGGKSNTGEGGEDPARFVPSPNGDSRNSAIKQIASGRFGVTADYLVHADEIQIKIAQGAKPGEGGQLPGHKVDIEIARLRHSIAGVQLISPPPHHDIYSIEDLAQLIFDLKNVNPAARISVKLVAAAGIGAVAVGVAKAGAHKILISGDGGGTGASPLGSIKHAGAPWEMGLAEVHQTLILNRLRERVVLETDGQLRTGRDVVIAAALGADEFGFSTAPLIVEGCIMMRKCHLNTCPVGVATQDPELRAKFNGKPEHVINFFFFVAEEVRQLLAQMGLRSLAAVIGRTELLVQKRAAYLPKAEHLNLSALLYKPAIKVGPVEPFTAFSAAAYDASLLEQCRPALAGATRVVLSRQITNAQRATGTLLAGEIARRFGPAGLKAGSISLRFEGSAGQSFGAFLTHGVSMHLAGAANDYVGKGLCGGQLIIVPPRYGRFSGSGPVLVGNTTLYGATSGALFVAGVAGERFAVRNSGATAVVEGVGDHGCEYMTGGVVLVLGDVGRNFGAGMSGGTAFVYDRRRLCQSRCNQGMIELEAMSHDSAASDKASLKQLLKMHWEQTRSLLAQDLLRHWEAALCQFVKIVPKGAKAAHLPQSLPHNASNGRVTRIEVPTHA